MKIKLYIEMLIVYYPDSEISLNSNDGVTKVTLI